MSTNTQGQAGPSYSLRRIQELIYAQPIRQPLKNVLLVHAQFCDYFTGGSSHPTRRTIALYASLGERRVKQIHAELRADPKCRKCKGVGIVKGSTGACPCQREGKGYLVPENSGTGGAGVATSYRLNLAAMEKILPPKKGAIFNKKGAIFNKKGAILEPKGGNFEQRNKDDRIDRVYRVDRGAPPRKGVSSEPYPKSKLEKALARIRGG